MSFALDFLLKLCPGGGIKWLLRDEFSDTRAAGAVNGTPATPGPGTRVVVENDGQFTISGGVLNIPIQATPDAGDLGFYLSPSIVRVAGRVFLYSIAKGDANIISGVGWASSVLLLMNSRDAMLQFSGVAQIDLRANNAAIQIANIGTLTGTDDIVAIVLSTAGAYYFLNNELLYRTASSIRTPEYAAIVGYSGIGTSSWLRIPDALWLPTPLAHDTFTRANGALGSSEVLGPDGQATPARTWVNRVGTTLVATNKAQASALVGGVAIATMDTGTADAIVSATLTRAGNEVGIILRYADADNYIRAIHDGTNCKLIKRVATVETDVISAVVALGAGAIRVIPDGTSFALYLNDAQVGATSTINDAALQTGTQQGLWSSNVGNTQDGFTVFPRGSNGEYAALNRWSF